MANIGNIIPIRSAGSDQGDPNKPNRVRSRVACQSCNHRKVRCDVTRTGIPCSNCMHENGHCEVLPRKKHRPRRSRAELQSLQPTTQINPTKSSISDTQNTSHSSGQSNGLEAENSGRSLVENGTLKPPRSSSLMQPPLLSIEQRSSYVKSDPRDSNTTNNKGTSHSIDPGDDLPDDSSLSYIGDKRGPRFFVYDLCQAAGSPQDAMPYLNPRKSDISWKPHEVEYLRHQGAFTTFSDEVCDDLIRCYFRHVHFFLPVVDAASFLGEYDNNGQQNISLLLFWTMLLAAANFVSPDVLQKSGFKSRKAMKTAIYARAKCLYDLDTGTDKLILIQSVILMTFWYTDKQDHTGAWYWIGIAIGLSQTLGLHRSPQNNRNQQLPESLQPLIRRMWWSCLVRDRWISLAKGRPMRIHHEDCDIPMPTADDILNNLTSIPIQTRNKFIPPEAEMLSKMWVNIVEISSILGRILRVHYRVNGPKALAEDIHTSAEDLRYCRPRGISTSHASELLRLHAFHLELFYEATVTVLYRPYVLSGSSSQPFDVEPTVQKMAFDQARLSAANTNGVLERIIELDMVHLLKPMMITTIIPAMQIHLFDCKSSEPLRRGLGTNKLNLCLLILSQLRDTYWSASVTYRLFARAQKLLAKSGSNVSTQVERPIFSPQQPIPQPIIQVAHTEQSHLHEQSRAQPLPQHQHQNLELQLEHVTQQQHQQRPGESMHLIQNSNMMMNEQAVPAWMNDSPYFTNVDQLLSPSFTLPEETFLYTSYDNGMDGFDQNIVPASEMPMDLLYRG